MGGGGGRGGDASWYEYRFDAVLAELKLPNPALRLLLPIVLATVLLSALDPLVLLLATLVAILVAMLSLAEPLLLVRACSESLLPVGVDDDDRELSTIWPHCTDRKRAVEPLPLRRFSATSVVVSLTSLSVAAVFSGCRGGGGGGRGGGLVGQGLLMSEDVGKEILRDADAAEDECVVGEPAADAGDVGLVADAWLSEELGKSRMVGMCLAMVAAEMDGTGGKRVSDSIDCWVGDATGGGDGDRTGMGAGRLGMKEDASLSAVSGTLLPPWSL